MKPDTRDLSRIDDLEAKINRLKYFYYIAAVGGMANDGDSFRANIKYHSREDFISKMKKLDITVKKMSETDNSGSPIPDILDLAQPGFVIIDEVRCGVRVWSKGIVEFAVFGTGSTNPYSFTMADYNACLRLEELFDSCGFIKDVDYQIENDRQCIYKKIK